MNIKEHIKAEHEKIKNLSNEVINENLRHLHNEHSNLDFCSDSLEAHEFLNKMEDNFMDEEDLEYYNFLLGRKPISYDFHPSNRRRSEALLAVISTI
jgi:ribosome assembly protein YihI (activator of Der GTPase)